MLLYVMHGIVHVLFGPAGHGRVCSRMALAAVKLSGPSLRQPILVHFGQAVAISREKMRRS